MAVAPALEDSAPGNNFRKTLPGALSSNEGLDSPVSMQTANLSLHGSRWQALLPLMVLHCHMVVVVVVAVVVAVVRLVVMVRVKVTSTGVMVACVSLRLLSRDIQCLRAR